MKSTLIPSITTAAMLAAAGAQVPGLPGNDAATAEEVGTLPKQKEQSALSSRLADGSRNPFATRTTPINLPNVAESQTEEARIRAVLEKFVINGIAKATSGTYSANLQGIILKEGELLPQVILDQVDELRVTKITSRLVEITWVGDEDAENPRRITRKVDMEPKIPFMLPSATPGTGGELAVGGPPLTAQNNRAPAELELDDGE